MGNLIIAIKKNYCKFCLLIINYANFITYRNFFTFCSVDYTDAISMMFESELILLAALCFLLPITVQCVKKKKRIRRKTNFPGSLFVDF